MNKLPEKRGQHSIIENRITEERQGYTEVCGRSRKFFEENTTQTKVKKAKSKTRKQI